MSRCPLGAIERATNEAADMFAALQILDPVEADQHDLAEAISMVHCCYSRILDELNAAKAVAKIQKRKVDNHARNCYYGPLKQAAMQPLPKGENGAKHAKLSRNGHQPRIG